MPLVLLYHDVVDRGRDDSSGFPGAGAARYKLSRAEFAAHVDAIAAAGGPPPVTLPELAGRPPAPSPPLLTFDDGGLSASSCIADELEGRGWRGHFFITVDYVGAPSFMDAGQVRALRGRGHLIGSHSCSHPARMSACGPEELLGEWRRSREVLSDLLGEPVTIASVPGGYYSRAVAEAAARAGIESLFTSEPTTRARTVAGCTVLGRYTIYRGMPARAAAALARGRAAPRLGQALSWNAKKIAKMAGGNVYISMRNRMLNRLYPPGIGGGR